MNDLVADSYRKPMKRIFSFFSALMIWSVSGAQADSLVIKLQKYKELYTSGLIDSQEYSALKAKLLDLNQQRPNYQWHETGKKEIKETEIFYDPASPDKLLPTGIYMSLDEIKTRHPSLNCNLKMRLRHNYDYENGVGGNVMLRATDSCISKGALKMDAWLFSDGVRCYINLERLKLQGFYNPVITMGRFLAFYKNQLTDEVDKAGAWGGSIGTEVAMATGNDYKKMYVIDTRAAMLFAVDHDYLLKVLKDYPAIKTKYLAEKDPADNNVMGKYLQEMNDAK